MQVPNGGPKDIKRHRTKLSRHGDLAPGGFFTPFLKDIIKGLALNILIQIAPDKVEISCNAQRRGWLVIMGSSSVRNKLLLLGLSLQKTGRADLPAYAITLS